MSRINLRDRFASEVGQSSAEEAIVSTEPPFCIHRVPLALCKDGGFKGGPVLLPSIIVTKDDRRLHSTLRTFIRPTFVGVRLPVLAGPSDVTYSDLPFILFLGLNPQRALDPLAFSPKRGWCLLNPQTKRPQLVYPFLPCFNPCLSALFYVAGRDLVSVLPRFRASGIRHLPLRGPAPPTSRGFGVSYLFTVGCVVWWWSLDG